jgi:radical SAM-linked protein
VDDRSAAREARQRWRIVFRRDAGADALAQRDVTATWEAGFVASGLPLATAGRRPRLVFGAPLPVGIAAERELADLFLAEVRPAHQVRAGLSAALPRGYELIDLFDVWLGAPSLASSVAGADYRVAVGGFDGPIAELEAGAGALLAARSLPRERKKGGGSVRYDLRPLLLDLAVAAPGPPPELRIRTRIDSSVGAGRPDEVVAALSDRVGRPLVVASTVRERLLLADDLASGSRASASRAAADANAALAPFD